MATRKRYKKKKKSTKKPIRKKKRVSRKIKTPKKRKVRKVAKKTKKARKKTSRARRSSLKKIPSKQRISKRTDSLGRKYYWDPVAKKRVSKLKWRQQKKAIEISDITETPYTEQYFNSTVITGAEEYVFRKKRWKIFVSLMGKSVRITQKNILWLSLFVNEILDIYFQLALSAGVPSPHVIFKAYVYSKNKIFNIQLDQATFVGVPSEMIPMDQFFKDYFERKL